MVANVAGGLHGWAGEHARALHAATLAARPRVRHTDVRALYLDSGGEHPSIPGPVDAAPQADPSPSLPASPRGIDGRAAAGSLVRASR
jgi:hypothetical protein